MLSTGKKQLASRFNLTYRLIDDVLSINNPEFENYLGQTYPAELEIKDTTESITSASYLDLLLSIGRDGQLHTSICDKRFDFNFLITNFPFLSSDIHEGSVPEMRIWSILLIKSDLKWNIHLSRSLLIFQVLGECHCWWTSESPRAHVAKFYGRLRLIRSVLRASKFTAFKLIEIEILRVYYTIPMALACFETFWDITVKLLKLLFMAKDH